MTEQSALLPENRKQNGIDYKSSTVYDVESTQIQQPSAQALLPEQPTKSVFAIIGLLLIGESLNGLDMMQILILEKVYSWQAQMEVLC